MTALPEYQRLESSGLWLASPDAQRRDVFVCFGDATIVLADRNSTALAHWSLPAIRRLNPGQRPALYSPDANAIETLELTDDAMIDAIERVQNAIARSQPHPGRLRGVLLAGGAAALIALAVFWLPDALIRYTASIVPDAKRAEIGRAMLANITRVAGLPCSTEIGDAALSKLQKRLSNGADTSLVVLSSGVGEAEHLPGGIILLGRSLVEDYEDAEVVAGYILAEQLRADTLDPLKRFLRAAGLPTAFRLLTTGKIPDATLAEYAEMLLTSPQEPLDEDALLARFETADLRSSPYAYARDHSGETTLALIEADPLAGGTPKPVLSDGDWVSLQGICGE